MLEYVGIWISKSGVPKFELFEKFDPDGSGEVSLEEMIQTFSKVGPNWDMADVENFFELIDETRSAYADALFSLIDVDGSGTISFEEMIQVLAAYCMYSKEDILNFCFDTFDKDGSGTIEYRELHARLRPSSADPVERGAAPAARFVAIVTAVFGRLAFALGGHTGQRDRKPPRHE